MFKRGIGGQGGWDTARRSPDPKAHYDVVVVGGGGQGLEGTTWELLQYMARQLGKRERPSTGAGNV